MSDSIITKSALAESLKTAMKSKRFEKISVSEICQNCGMTRKSFYYHFQDKYDLVHWIFTHDFATHIHMNQNSGVLDFIDELVRYFYSDREFYREILRVQGQNGFREIFMSVVKPVMDQFAYQIFENKALQEMHYYVTFFCEGLLSVITGWLESDCDMDPEQFIQSTHTIMEILAARMNQDKTI
jgi:probable dihydroxyacetone kinase regulator